MYKRQGRIQNGVAKVGEEVVVCDWHNPDLKMRGRLTKLYDFQANGRQPCDNITAGDVYKRQLETTAGLWASSYLTLVRQVPAQTAASFASLFYICLLYTSRCV